MRDSDPQTKTASRTDLLMERGSKVLSQNMSISLDTSWHTDFHFQGNGKRDADDFFYQPYITAENYVDSRTSMKIWAIGRSRLFWKISIRITIR